VAYADTSATVFPCRLLAAYRLLSTTVLPLSRVGIFTSTSLSLFYFEVGKQGVRHDLPEVKGKGLEGGGKCGYGMCGVQLLQG
jgi:hypothetical protein